MPQVWPWKDKNRKNNNNKKQTKKTRLKPPNPILSFLKICSKFQNLNFNMQQILRIHIIETYTPAANSPKSDPHLCEQELQTAEISRLLFGFPSTFRVNILMHPDWISQNQFWVSGEKGPLICPHRALPQVIKKHAFWKTESTAYHSYCFCSSTSYVCRWGPF